MATYNSLSSEQLVNNAVKETDITRADILIGGLGLGYSVKAAVLHKQKLQHIHVVELDEMVIEWNQTLLAELNGRFLRDERVKVIQDDFIQYVYTTDNRYHIICMDIDNGPMLISNLGNMQAYSGPFYQRIYDILESGGIFVIWSCGEDEALLKDLQAVFDKSWVQVINEIFKDRKMPYYLYFGMKA